MSEIQLAAKKEFTDVLNATFLYFDSVTPGTGVYVIIYYESGHSERQEIVSGSKFTQGIDGQKIWKIKFINPSLVTVDINYRYSVLYGYDESRLYGEVSLATGTAINLTPGAAVNIAKKTTTRNYYTCTNHISKNKAFSNSFGNAFNFHIERLTINSSSAVATNTPETVSRVVVTGLITQAFGYIGKLRNTSPNSTAQALNGDTLEQDMLFSAQMSMYKKQVIIDLSDKPLILAPGEAIALNGANTMNIIYEEVAI